MDEMGWARYRAHYGAKKYANTVGSIGDKYELDVEMLMTIVLTITLQWSKA